MSNYTAANLAFKTYMPIEKGASPDVILLHGITGNKEMFNHIGQNIADKSGRKVYSLDMRNHGDSSWSHEFSWKLMANDVSHFMDEYCISSATLVGHNMGGFIAMILALEEPKKVESLVVEDMSPILPKKETMTGIAGMIEFTQNILEYLPPDIDFSKAIRHLAREVAKNIPQAMQMTKENKERFFSFFQTLYEMKSGRIVSKMNSEVLKKFLKDPKNHTDLQGLCQKPALFLYGSKSTFKVMDDKERILELFPNSQLKALEGATHFGHMEFPEEFSEAVLQFLNK